MSSKQSKKSKKKMVILSIAGVLILSLAAGLIFTPKGAGAFEEERAETADITTYYSFSGAVEAKNRQNIISKKEMHVEEVLVKEGDLVKKDDVLLRNSEGEEINAEIAGEVAKVYTKNNSHALKGSQLIDIVDYSNLHIKVKVDEYDLKYVAVDQQVNVTINALEKEIQGTVYAISKEATNENGISYFTAFIDFNNDKAIRIGMSAEAQVLKDNAKGVTTVPMKAVQFDNKNKPYVLKASEKGKPAKKYVKTGVNDGSTIEIKSGISLGDVVMIPDSSSEATNHAAHMQGGGSQ
ncbi:efflux RND transporter periplasmic adaptor subunit [Bacillus sp. T33-2]|uniref:efflux RND transporter periplasmic adaptor subunit n=1 Tax=Bacillus sp. T33-2 TaxID=2054168 RepID=UPI0015E14E69|nr:HlyD family efflux transporter periplasmic adaptor subunit [Bacillus sp. T33-2]